MFWYNKFYSYINWFPPIWLQFLIETDKQTDNLIWMGVIVNNWECLSSLTFKNTCQTFFVYLCIFCVFLNIFFLSGCHADGIFIFTDTNRWEFKKTIHWGIQNCVLQACCWNFIGSDRSSRHKLSLRDPSKILDLH